MKTRSIKKRQRSGLVTILSVVVIGGFLLAIMGIMYRGSIRSLEAQKKVQLQVDYDARKQAYLRAVVTMAPVSIANTMLGDPGTNFLSPFAEQALFNDANSVSSIGITRSAADGNGMEFVYENTQGESVPCKNGNTGSLTSIIEGVVVDGAVDIAAYTDPVDEVTAETLVETHDDKFGDFPIDYPNIHFGYYSLDAEGKKKFIAKRNSWTLNVHERAADIAAAGLSDGMLTDEYILDVYEIPAQLAISSSAFTNIGQIGGGNYDAGNSGNITIDGNIYAKKATVSHGTVDGVSTTKGATLTGETTVGDYNSASDIAGARTAHENTNATFYPISKASDYARTLFLPINTGFNFFDRLATSDAAGDANTAWDVYSCGSHQCKMQLDVIDVVAVADQTPTALRFFCDGMISPVIIRRSLAGAGEILWPESSADDGYDTFPFLLESSSGTPAIAVHLEKLADWIVTEGGSGPSVNSSLVVNADYDGIFGDGSPSEPGANASPLVVILRDCDDLTDFTAGFSIVTNYTLHVLEDLNQTEGDRDIGGFGYPALSVFAPTIQYGINDQFRSVSLTGSLGSLNQTTDEVNILELKATNDSASADQTFAELKPIEKIGDLPPINVMNWLVMIKQAD